MRTLNVRLAVVLLVAVAVILGGVHYLHSYQIRRNAYVYKDASARAIERAKKAGEENNKTLEEQAYREAMQNYAVYLRARPDDINVQEEFAMLSAERALLLDRPRDPASLARAYGRLEHVLRQDPDRVSVRRRLVEVAMRLGRYPDARKQLEEVLLKKSPDDPQLLSWYGQCQTAMGEHTAAMETLKKVIEHGPDQVDVYPQLAATLRSFSKSKEPDQWSEEADHWMEKLVMANPKSARAHVLRGGYCLANVNLVGAAVAKAALADEAVAEASQALELAPDDRDGLLLATRCSIVKAQMDPAHAPEQMEPARGHAEHGIELFPNYIPMYVALADVEWQARSPDKAIAVLEKGLTATDRNPSLLQRLAQVLIDAGQVERAQQVVTELQGTADHARYKVDIDYIEARIEFAQRHWLKAREGFEGLRSSLAMRPELLKQVDAWIGECYGAVGDWEREVQACRRALAIDPFFPPARAGLIDALRALGHTGEAIEEFNRLARFGSMNFEVALELVRMMMTATLRQNVAERNWEPVEKALDQLAQMRPDSTTIPIVRAEILVEQDRMADAEQLLQEAFDKNPKESGFLPVLASLAERQKDWSKAEERLEALRKLTGDSVEQRLAQGEYLWRRHGKDAADDLRKLAENTDNFSKPQLLQLWNGLLGVALQVEDSEQSKRLSRRIAENDPSNVQIRYLLFEQALQAKDDALMDQALSEIERVAGQTAYWSYGQAVRLAERAKDAKNPNELLDQALGYLAKARTLRQSWTRIPLMMGEFYYQEGKWNEALKSYQEAIDAGERNPIAIQKAVRLLFQQQRYADADQLLQRLEEQQIPLSPELNRRGAESALFQGEFERALDMARKSASQDSTNYQEHLWLGEVMRELGRRAKINGQTAQSEQLFSDAEKSLRHAVELEPTAADAWVALVRFLAASRKTDQAAEAVKEASEKIPPDKAPLALAQCYEAINDIEAARKQCEAALAASPNDPTVIRFVADFDNSTGKPEPAETLLRKIIDGTVPTSEADVSGARRQLATILAARGSHTDLLKARELIEKNRAADERSLADRRVLARLDAIEPSRSRHDEAIRILEGIVQEQSATSQDRFALAQLYLAVGAWTKANAQFRNLLISYGNEPVFLTAYITALLQHGETSNAEAYVDRLEKIAPADFSTINLRAAALVEKGEYNRGVGALNGFVENGDAQPADRNERLRLAAEAIEQLGRRLKKPGQEALADQFARKAQVMFEAYVAANPEHSLALVAFLGRQGDLAGALNVLENASAADPQAMAQACATLLTTGKADKEQLQRLDTIVQAALDRSKRAVPLLLTLASLRTWQARYADAEACYREILAKDNNVVALNNLAVLLAMQGVKLDESLKLINQAIEIAGPVAAMLDSRATVYMAQGRSREALKDIEAALADAESPVWLFHQARAYEEAGQHSSAVAAMQKAMKKGLTPQMLEALELPAFEKFRAF